MSQSVPAGKDTNPPGARADSPTRLRSQTVTLGSVMSILMRSAEYRKVTLGEIEALIAPPLGFDQVAIAEARDAKSGAIAPVALVLWASVSAEVDARLGDVSVERPRLTPGDWQSGDIPWIIAIAGNKAAAGKLLEQLIKARFAETPPKIRVKKKDGTSAIGFVQAGAPLPDPHLPQPHDPGASSS